MPRVTLTPAFLFLAVVPAGVFAAPTPALAEPAPPPAGRVEVGALVGAHFFADDLELGVTDADGEARPESAPLLGARVSVRVITRLHVEAEAVAVPTSGDLMDDRATVLGWRVHARVPLLLGRVRPFVVAGVGSLTVFGSGDYDEGLALVNDTDAALHWGAGAEIDLTRRLALRIDARHLLLPSTGDRGASSDLEISAGLGWRLGGAPARARIVIAPPPPPLEPASDLDGDGVLDPADQCPAEMEDIDRHNDADGCPELDNDGDGLKDKVDECPDVAETVNDFEDSDGCADEAPPPVMFDGVLDGITFASGSDEIEPTSFVVLSSAAAELAAWPAIRVEISGHTSSEGDATLNRELSRTRAEAVRAYLIANGVAADRLEAAGYGSERPIADDRTREGRERNRRIEFHVIH